MEIRKEFGLDPTIDGFHRGIVSVGVPALDIDLVMLYMGKSSL